MPPCRLRRRKFWKFDYEMVHSEVYLCCQNSAVLYTCLPRLLSNVQKTALVLHVSLSNFSSIFPGGSTGPICTYVRTPMIFKVACMAGVRDRWCVKTKWSWELASDTRRFVLRDKTARIKKNTNGSGNFIQRCKKVRRVQRWTWVGSIHGLGWVRSHFPAHVMGWVTLGWMRSTVAL